MSIYVFVPCECSAYVTLRYRYICLYDPHTALSLLSINDRFRPYLIGLADTFLWFLDGVRRNKMVTTEVRSSPHTTT